LKKEAAGRWYANGKEGTDAFVSTQRKRSIKNTSFKNAGSRKKRISFTTHKDSATRKKGSSRPGVKKRTDRVLWQGKKKGDASKILYQKTKS